MADKQSHTLLSGDCLSLTLTSTTPTPTPLPLPSSGRHLVLLDTNSRILKGALEKGMNAKSRINNMGSNSNNNYTPTGSNGRMMNMTPVVTSVTPVTPTPTQNFPYDTDTLRRLVLEKFFRRSSNPKYIMLRDESVVREAFLDFVLHVPILVDGHRVGRKAWAKAFYETDIINSAKCLFEALFSEEEMRICTLNGKNQTQELSAVKMLAILRASCWMKDKEQDPYLFNPEIPEHNVHPTREEQDKIEKKVFTERRSQANRKNRKRQPPRDGQASSFTMPEGDSDSQNMDLNSNASDEFGNATSPGGESYSSLTSLSPRPHSNQPSVPIPRDVPTYEFGELEELFYRYPEEFLDTLLPSWRDSYIFIDGLLVDLDKWKKAWEEVADPVKAAWTLFLALFSDVEIKKCTLNGKNGTTELCPVKKLAIIRAVEWMRRCQEDPEMRDLDLMTYWDNDDEDCNVFPSKEDKEKIETKVFTEKRYQQSRHLNLSKPSMSLSMSTSTSSASSTASLSPPYQNQGHQQHPAMQMHIPQLHTMQR